MDKSEKPVSSHNLVETFGIMETKASENIVDAPVEKVPIIKESQVLESVSRTLEDEELEENRLLNEVVTDVDCSVETTELRQNDSDNIEEETSSQDIASSLQAEIPSIALQSDDSIDSHISLNKTLCEPIDVLENLTVVAEELTRELTDSVSSKGAHPLTGFSQSEILTDTHLSVSEIVNSNESKNSEIIIEFCEIKEQSASPHEKVDDTCFNEDSNQTPSVSSGTDYVTEVITSPMEIENTQLADSIEDLDEEDIDADEFEQSPQEESVITSDNSDYTVFINKTIPNAIDEPHKLEIEQNLDVDNEIEIDLPLKQEEETLIECAVLQASDDNISLPDEVLLDAEDMEQTEILCNAPSDNVDTSQQSSEISELESAVNEMQSEILFSPKIPEDIVEETSEQSKPCLFSSETDVSQESLELSEELEKIPPDSIPMSEEEVISEAAKLDNECEVNIASNFIETSEHIVKLTETEDTVLENSSLMLENPLTTSETLNWQRKSEEDIESTSTTSEICKIPKLSENIVQSSENIIETLIVEESSEDPPKIEIPVSEISPRLSDMPITSKPSLSVQSDSETDVKTTNQEMLEYPEGGDKSDLKIVSTPRKESETCEIKNLGSPKIILNEPTISSQENQSDSIEIQEKSDDRNDELEPEINDHVHSCELPQSNAECNSADSKVLFDPITDLKQDSFDSELDNSKDETNTQALMDECKKPVQSHNLVPKLTVPGDEVDSKVIENLVGNLAEKVCSLQDSEELEIESKILEDEEIEENKLLDDVETDSHFSENRELIQICSDQIEMENVSEEIVSSLQTEIPSITSQSDELIDSDASLEEASYESLEVLEQYEKSEVATNLQSLEDNSETSVVSQSMVAILGNIESKEIENLLQNPTEGVPSPQESQQLANESRVSEDEEIEENKLLNDIVINVNSPTENPELIQSCGDEKEIENSSQEIESSSQGEILPIPLHSDDLIDSDVSLDETSCEPIEVLEKLTTVGEEILMNELTDSVSSNDIKSVEDFSQSEILNDSHLSMSPVVSSDRSKITEVTIEFCEIKEQSPSPLEEANDTCFNEDSNLTPNALSDTDDVTNVITSSTDTNNIQLEDNIEDMDDGNMAAIEYEPPNQEELVKPSEIVDYKSIENIINEPCQLEIEQELTLDNDTETEIDLPIKEEEETFIECAVLQACDDDMSLPDEVLLDAEDTEQTDGSCNAPADNIDISQQSSEISELECAVKFLQESEEQTIDSALVLSPKVTENTAEQTTEQNKPCLFLSETERCQETLELPAELEEITPDSIAISEAEIISEAAKLENERKLKIAAELNKTSESIVKLSVTEDSVSENSSQMLKNLLTGSGGPSGHKKFEENIASTCETPKSETRKIPENIIRRSETIPKTSILEERLKEPPKIEIPVPEVSPRLSDVPTTPKTSLLIQRDLKADAKTMYQKMLESPKGGDKSEPKIMDTPRKESDKYDFENVGSPRIILKIAKSAIADCGEPRSPKSPKIRSAANSPNPEDSPGQKLGKIKLKLSRGGHPSIISNENFDETVQRHTEPMLSPSHIGMKIKLSKTGDASIIPPEKHDSMDEIKEGKYKYDEVSPKRIESPLGMKIKLSKTGEPSIVQQESREPTSKRKDKLDIGLEIPKRTDSPIGMKIKLSKSGDASIIQPQKQETSEEAAYKDKFEIATEIPKRTDSPIGMKIKLSKTGDASIIPSESSDDFKDGSLKSREKLSNTQDIPKRTDSPLGMKFKLSKSGGASIIQPDKSEIIEEFRDKNSENVTDITKRVESPIGMKIKLLKTGDASIIHTDKPESDDLQESIMIKHREKSETQEIQKRTDSPIGMRIKVTKTGEASVVSLETSEESKQSSSSHIDSFEMVSSHHEVSKRNESLTGIKINLPKTSDSSILHREKQGFNDQSKECIISSRGYSATSQESCKSTESSLGMKIKLSKSGDASIIHPEISSEFKDLQSKRVDKLQSFQDGTKRTDSPLGMKIKLSKSGDASIIEPDKKEKSALRQKEKSMHSPDFSQKRKDMEFPLEMKIKLSKTGHPTIIANEKQESLTEIHTKTKDLPESGPSIHHKRTEQTSTKDSQLRILKTGHSTIIQSNQSEVTIEPVQMLLQKPENTEDLSPKGKDLTISPVESKKSKLEAKLSQILPEVTIQPVVSGEQKQMMFEQKSSLISQQQMSVINQEISITQVPLSKPADLSMSGKLKEILRKNASNSPVNSDCEIIEHRPELIIVNENSNSSQDVMIIEEVKVPLLEVKVPRKRGRPKRSSLLPGRSLMREVIPQDPLALDNMPQSGGIEHRESDRPKRTCRNQKSYAPPKRGRGRGRGKRKMDRMDCAMGKILRLEDPLTAIERSTMSLIAPPQPRIIPETSTHTSELYKALQQSPTERKRLISETVVKHGFPQTHKKFRLEADPEQSVSDLPAEPKPDQDLIPILHVDISEILQHSDPISEPQTTDKLVQKSKPEVQENKSCISEITTTEPQNWLTPSIKLPQVTSTSEAMSIVQVMDEETRMSAESNSRSQTPARNISMPAVETAINEESQGSVLSTATTESEKVKVKNRRMEINFDPDEGPFTVDKIAEYEWPLDKKGDTFMIQEQISQYLGVKSFKRKYPDLKRRMVEMEERNYLRENCLVSEAMCDMGLTAICSTEVLDVMCGDFPDQYEEYRKHMREKQAKEHSKKQKELTAAANAERNRIDLAEMAVQSALCWNVNFNKARKESRKYSLDLQSFTVHQPHKQQKVDAERKVSNYPVALIPGQYTDYYREYTPAELRYYPLNTVLYGPMRPNERKFDSQSEGSQSDSDSDSSSDDSSSSSSEGTQDTEESQSTVDEVEMEIATNKEDNKNLKCKMCLKHLNKHGKAEVLIQCGTCNGNVHPSCIDLTLDMVPHIQGYRWQCTDCKTCVQCHNPADEDKMLFCDMCDRGYHIYCVGLRRVPQGRWHCQECAVCASCGLRQPGGANSDRNSVAQWQHEYKKGERNTRVYVSTLCVPCSKLWRKGRYCPHCSRCHSAQRLDLEPNLIHCGACDKYLHLGCVEIRSGILDRKHYICEYCSTLNQRHSRSFLSKSFKT